MPCETLAHLGVGGWALGWARDFSRAQRSRTCVVEGER